MTMTSDFHTPQGAVTCKSPKRGGSRTAVRVAQRVAASALGISAFAVWMAPGGLAEADMMLFKLLTCLVAVLLGAGLWQASGAQAQPTVKIDVAAEEIRLIHNGAGLIERTKFADLGRAEQNGRHIAFWDNDGRLLAEIALSNATAHATLLAALRRAGKLNAASARECSPPRTIC